MLNRARTPKGPNLSSIRISRPETNRCRLGPMPSKSGEFKIRPTLEVEVLVSY